LIVGPHDPTDRFTYWPGRIAQGGEVLAPGDPNQQVQFIDVRDLAEWIIKLVEVRQVGLYQATGPRNRLSMRDLLAECRTVSQSSAEFTWIDEQFLLAAGAQPWTEIPVWVAASDATFQTANCGKAIGAGLTYRALAETIRDTLQWNATRPGNIDRQAGLKIDRERELLQQWHAKARQD
jgi:2'-hydroxyisoflavone reductase